MGLMAIMGVIWGAAPVAAAPYTVNSANDPGDGTCNVAECTLREALTAAGAAGPDTITITTTGTIGLASALPNVPDQTTIQGPGQSTGGISATGVGTGLTVPAMSNATISGLRVTFANNHGILNQGNTTLSNDGISYDGNGSADGGGIDNQGALTVLDSMIQSNTGAAGGGIKNEKTGTVIVRRTTFHANSAFTAGGGGISNSGSLTLENSTIYTNFAHFYGGGVDNYCGDANCAATVTMNSDTIVNNVADTPGSGTGTGGGVQQSDEGSFTVANTLLAYNSHGNAPGVPDQCGTLFGGVYTSGGYNLSTDATCGFGGPGEIVNSSPGLGGLDDNGGPTLTVALQPGSPAIDSGSPSAPATDQRGVSRPQGAHCDIGAYEANASLLAPTCAGPTSPAGATPASAATKACPRHHRKHRAARASKSCKKKRKKK